MEEIWKDVVGYECYYEVSDMGNVRRKSRNILKTYTPKDNYPRVTFTANHKRNLFLVHRLVAIAFIRNPENKKEVNHINGKKSDNRACNLEWASAKENTNHAIAIGLIKDKRGEKSHLCKTSEFVARDIKFNCKKDMNTKKIFATKHGVPIHIVNDIMRGRSWKWLI